MNSGTRPSHLHHLTGSTTGRATTQIAPPEWALPPARVAFHVSLLLAILCSGVASNALNGLMLLKSKRPSTNMHILMFNLVVVDMAMSVTCIPLSVLFTASNGAIAIPDELCKVAAYLLQTLIIASLFTQSAISVLRTAAIRYHEQLQKRLPPRTAYKILVYVWLQASLTPLLPFLSHDHEDLFTYHPRFMAYTISDEHTELASGVIFSVVAYLLPLSIICVSYVGLYVSLRRHLKKSFLVRDKCSRHMYTVQMRVHVKVGCLVIFVVSSTLLIWVPFYIMSCISLFEQEQFESLSRNASAALIFGASSVNPIMYGFMNASLRQEFKSYLAAKHPKLAARLSRLRCCRCCRRCCKMKPKLDAVIVIPREQLLQNAERGEAGRGPGSISGQLVLQINHEINLMRPSVFSTRYHTDPGEMNTAKQPHREAAAMGGRASVPPLLKRCSWTQSLAQNARRFSGKVSRRRSGPDSANDSQRQLPLLDLNAVSHGCTATTFDPGPFPKAQEKPDPWNVAESHPDENKTKYQPLSPNPLSPRPRQLASGRKDPTVAAVSQCFKNKPVFGDVVKVRRVFIEEVRRVPGFQDQVSGRAVGRGVGVTDRPQSLPRESPVSSVDSQLFAGTTTKTSEDVNASTMAVQLPGCIQAIPDK